MNLVNTLPLGSVMTLHHLQYHNMLPTVCVYSFLQVSFHIHRYISNLKNNQLAVDLQKFRVVCQLCDTRKIVCYSTVTLSNVLYTVQATTVKFNGLIAILTIYLC